MKVAASSFAMEQETKKQTKKKQGYHNIDNVILYFQFMIFKELLYLPCYLVLKSLEKAGQV